MARARFKARIVWYLTYSSATAILTYIQNKTIPQHLLEETVRSPVCSMRDER
jgi:hypothetical protein